MKKFLSGAFVVVALVGGSLVAVAPAQAFTPSDVVTSATTTLTGDCHAGVSNVVTKVLVPTDTLTVTLTNCNTNWTPNTDTWKYGDIWTNVTRGNGGTGVRAPNTFIVTDDQQCIQQNSTNNFTSVPYNLAGFTTELADSVTSNLQINAYDFDTGACGTTGGIYHRAQQVWKVYPATPTATLAFAAASVGTIPSPR